MANAVSVLLLGSGWTSRFLLPALREKGISYAFTKRNPSYNDSKDAIAFEVGKEGAQDASTFESLPQAKMVVIIFPLTSPDLVDQLIETYEKVKTCQPAWLALGSTGAWSKGLIASSSPTLESSARAVSEAQLLLKHTTTRRTAVLNLAGLYGGGRNPANFAKKVGETLEKLEQKTSLHLVHGVDVAQAIVGMYEALGRSEERVLWGRRWIVTDSYVYDWWQLCTTLQPPAHSDFGEWIIQLTKKHDIAALPRPIIGQQHGDQNRAPYVLDRALDGNSFWQTLGRRPLIGRCDNYSAGGGGKAVQDETSSKESL